MKKLVLVVLLLSLVIIISKGYKFGDIIAFDRVNCPCNLPLYKHFAIYVGNETFPNKTEDQDIFHRSGPDKRSATCKFDKLEDVRHGRSESLLNYLDNETITPDRKNMTDRIIEMINPEKCKEYEVLSNNCEHLATYVRYGKADTNQPGAVAEYFLKCRNAWKSCVELCKEILESE